VYLFVSALELENSTEIAAVNSFVREGTGGGKMKEDLLHNFSRAMSLDTGLQRGTGESGEGWEVMFNDDLTWTTQETNLKPPSQSARHEKQDADGIRRSSITSGLNYDHRGTASQRRQASNRNDSNPRSPPVTPLSRSRGSSRNINSRPRSKSPANSMARPGLESTRRSGSTRNLRDRSKSPAPATGSRPRRGSLRNSNPHPRSKASRRNSTSGAVVRSRSRSPGMPDVLRASDHQHERRRKPKAATSPKRGSASEIARGQQRSSRQGSSRNLAGGDLSASLLSSSNLSHEFESSQSLSFHGLGDEQLKNQSGYMHSRSDTPTSEHLDEDDDIIDDEDEHSLAVKRFRRQTGLPPDPIGPPQELTEGHSSSARMDRFNPRFSDTSAGTDRFNRRFSDTTAGIDRFNATFNNYNTWMDGEQSGTVLADAETPRFSHRKATSSNDASSPSRRTITSDFGSESQKTPKTPKTNNSGEGRRRTKLRPSMDAESFLNDQQRRHDANHSPVYQDESGRNSSSRKRAETDSGRRAFSTSWQSGNPHYDKNGSHSDRTSGVSMLLSPGGTPTSPMTSSFTSTPKSFRSSSQNQKNSLQALLRFHSNNTRKRNGTGLDDHLGRDEMSVGASTITTNFTITQRDRDDATVSERSLFQPTSSHPSQMPKIPQRRPATFDEQDYEGEDFP